MANHYVTSIMALALLFGVLLGIPTSVQSIGVCYGRLGDNIPSPADTVKLYKSHNINAMRLYSPDADALQALRGTGIQVILDVPNPDLRSIASDPSSASSWVDANVKAYAPDVSFGYIAVGNEAIPGDDAQYVLPALQNIKNAVSGAGLDQIKVSTSVSQGVLGQSYPPSSGAFSSDALPTLQPIVQYLAQTGAPLLVNVYPYFSYIYGKDISLDYALFTAPGTVVNDGPYQYQNLFDAIVDSLYAALERAGGANVPIVVSESGWPSAGGDASTTTVENARTYNQNLIGHVGKGTPKRPGKIEAYIFDMFNEDQKGGAETEKHFGLFDPSTQQPVYPINFS